MAENKDSGLMKMHKVFVYGTLLRGYWNHDRCLTGQTFLKEATTAPEYTMLHLGGFPGIVEGGKTTIIGEVYEVSEDCLLNKLDRLEGYRPSNPEKSMYIRKTITLTDGTEVYTYIYNRSTRFAGRGTERPAVASGSWRQEEPPKKRFILG